MVLNHLLEHLFIDKGFTSFKDSLLASFKRITLFFFSSILCLLFVLDIPASFADTDYEPPLTAHGNYDIFTKHGGLTWTPENVLGKNKLVIHSYHEGDKKTDATSNPISEKKEEETKNLEEEKKEEK